MGVGRSTSRAWIVPCLWCLVWARSILWVVLNSWRGITLGQNVRPLARIGACRALQGLMWGRAESRGGTEQPISCQRECRWHDSLRRDETRRFICPCLGRAAQHSPFEASALCTRQIVQEKASLFAGHQHSISSSTPPQCSTDQGKQGLCSNKRTNQTHSIPLLGLTVG